MATWVDNVLGQMKERDLREKSPFETIINSHAALWNSNQVLIKQRDKLRAASMGSAVGSGSSPAIGTVEGSLQQQQLAPSAANTKELERKIEKLQAELTASYRKEAKEATSQLALEAELRQLQNNEQAMKAGMDRLRLKLKETQALLEEEQRSGGRAREEATTLRDELIRVRRLLEIAEGKNRQLAKDNASLLDRILSEKLKVAEELNRMSQMYEEMQILLREKEQELAEARGRKESGNEKKQPESSSRGEDRTGNSEAADNAPHPTTKDVVGQVKGGAKRTQAGTLGVDSGGPSISVGGNSDAGSGDVTGLEALPSIPLKFQAHDSEVPMIRFDETGSRLFTCSCDGTIKVWDASSGVLQKTLRSPVDVQLMGMDVKEKIVIGTGSDRTLRIWSLETERLVQTLTGHASKLYACRLTNDARIAVTGGTDRKVITWDVATGTRQRLISCSSIVNAVAVSEEGSYIATGHQDTSVRMWDMRSGKMVLAVTDCHTNTVTSVEFTRLNRILTNSRDNTLSLIDLVSGKTEARFADIGYKSAYNWSSSDSSPSASLVGAGGANGNVYIWSVPGNASASKATTVLEHSEKRIAAFAFSPIGDGKCATADEDGLVVLWKSKKQ